MAATEEAVVGYKELPGNSLMLQWLGIHALSSGAPGSTPGQETKILQTTGTGEKKKQQRTSQGTEIPGWHGAHHAGGTGQEGAGSPRGLPRGADLSFLPSPASASS